MPLINTLLLETTEREMIHTTLSYIELVYRVSISLGGCVWECPSCYHCVKMVWMGGLDLVVHVRGHVVKLLRIAGLCSLVYKDLGFRFRVQDFKSRV